MPQCSNYTSAFKYYDLRCNRKWKNDPTMERIERQQLLSRKRKRTRQLHFDSARSTGTEESASGSETICDEFGFVGATVVGEEQREFTDDDLIMSEEVASGQIESNAYRIDIQVYTPESLIDAEIESELSDSEISFLESDSDMEREEDGYLTSEFFENDESDSDGEDESSMVVSIEFRMGLETG